MTKDSYRATFGIDCGVSTGYCQKRPEQVEITEEITAESPEDAYRKSNKLAIEYADNYLSNPVTGRTIVQLMHLEGPEGEIQFDHAASFIERTTLDHLLSI